MLQPCFSKILVKSSQNPLKPFQKPSSKQDASKMRPTIDLLGILSDFPQLLESPGPPKIEPKLPKNAKKARLKKYMLFNSIFLRFFIASTSENDAKIDRF
jgi:hypothetical protein